jgi:hypothetical protein
LDDLKLDALPRIPVERFRPLRGTMSFSRAEEGAQVNIDIPLAPFDSGLPQDNPPIQTAFDLVLYLPVDAIDELDGREFAPQPDDCHSTIYLGSAHNPVHVPAIRFRRVTDKVFHVACRLACDFAFERMGEPAVVALETELDVDFDGSPR